MSPRILVVDDESQIRDLLSLYLARKGFEVLTAATSAETLETLGKTKVDLVVLDISLAGEDGMAVLETLKSRHPQVKVVMLTGMGFVEDLLQEAQEKGADGYVSKVLPMDELVLALRNVLQGDQSLAA